MAGQPKKRAMILELRRRADEECGDSNAIVEFVELWVASGKTLTDLAKSVSAVCNTHVMRESLSKYVHSLGSDGEIEARLLRARARGGSAVAEETLTIADEATEDDVQVAALRVKSRQWLAERWNRSELGQDKGVNVQISLPGLHLDVMRARTVGQITAGSAQLAGVGSEEILDAEVEVSRETEPVSLDNATS